MRVFPGLARGRLRLGWLVVSLLVAGFTVLASAPPAGAASLSVDQFVATYNGRYVDFDGYYGAQCVDLFEYYNRDVVGAPVVRGDAYQLYGNAPTAYYDKLPPGVTPAKGDVAIWNSTLPFSGGAGHVAIVLGVVNASTLQVFGQNSPSGHPSELKNASTSYLLGYLHPKKFTMNPFGSFDTIDSPAPGQVHVRGWAVDPNSPTTSLDVHVYVGGPAGSAQGVGTDTGLATTSRPDVGAAYPGVGDNHGYDAVVDTHGGTVPVYVYAINAPGTPGDNVLLGEKDVAVADANPIGSFDGLSSPQGGELRVTGWDLDPSAPTTSIDFHVYVGGPAGDPNAVGYAFGPADADRPDVGTAFPGVGDHHGIDLSFATTKTGVQPVYLYAIDVGPGDNVLLGSRTVDVGTGPPHIGSTLPPHVRGTRRVGSTLQGTHGQWSVTGITFRYRWLRDGHPITHAAGRQYVVRRADRGHHLRVRVVAAKNGYLAGAARSAATHRIR